MYNQSITRSHRAAFVIAVDQSGSMAESLTFQGRTMPKSEAVVAVVDALLWELYNRSYREGGVRNYYDISVVGYSGDQVSFLIDPTRAWIPIDELRRAAHKQRTITTERTMPDGGIGLSTSTTPSWIEPKALGLTPMYEAMLQIRDMVDEWSSKPQNRDSFPPVVFNITDGESTDSDSRDLLDMADQIKSVATADGNVLLLNIHIASNGLAQGVLFMCEDEIPTSNKYARLLFDMSSAMPDVFQSEIASLKGEVVRSEYRGCCFNASIAELLSVLNIGSVSVKLD